MNGIYAAWAKSNPRRVADVLDALTVRLPAGAPVQCVRDTLPGLGVGMAIRGQVDRPHIFRNDRILLVTDADLLNEAELAHVAGCDTERPGPAAVLAALFEQWGERFVEKLRGAFSLILWDHRQRRLLAATDGFGIKRLAWYEDDELLLVGSRADAVRAASRSRQINPHAIANVLNFSANLGDETVFTGVRRVMPGTWLLASDRQTRLESYWDMRYGTYERASESELSRELESVVAHSVSDHCSGEPLDHLGAFLSGGTDSSTIVGLMTRWAGSPVKAFSIGFEEAGFSELEYAGIAARTFGADHHTYLVSADDCVSALPDIVAAFDEPFGNSSAVATYFCARLAAEAGVTTLLAGDGGDELFGGNEWYATEKLFGPYQALPKWLRTGLIEPVAALPIETVLTRKVRGYIRRANMQGVERVLSYQFLRTHALGELFESDFLGSLGGYSVLDVPSRHYAAAPARDHLDRLLYVDMKITIADNDLPKVTCMSDLARVRPRFPFLDRSVAEFSGRIPARLKVKGFQKRYLFKRAFRSLLPAPVIQKKKHGFGVPVALWMKSHPRMRELARDTLFSTRAVGRGYFRSDFVRELFRRHEAGEGTYYGDILWTFLMLELWHRQVVDEPVQVPA